MEGLYYEHSGKFSVTGVLYATVVGSVLTCFAAFIYAYLILYLPFVWINFLITCLFGLIVGFTCSALLKRKKVRSDRVAVLVTLVITSVAYYYSWVAWLWALVRRNDGDVHTADFFGLLLQPWLVGDLVLKVNETGAWSLRGGDPVTGVMLWIVWAIELAAIFGCSLFVAYSNMDAEPFCETCDQWAKKSERVVEAAASNVPEFKQRMESKDFKYLENMGAPAADAVEWQRIHVFSCDKCGVFHTLDSESVKVKVESGKRKEETSTSMHHLILTASEAEGLRKLGAKLNAAPPAADAAAATAGS